MRILQNREIRERNSTTIEIVQSCGVGQDAEMGNQPRTKEPARVGGQLLRDTADLVDEVRKQIPSTIRVTGGRRAFATHVLAMMIEFAADKRRRGEFLAFAEQRLPSYGEELTDAIDEWKPIWDKYKEELRAKKKAKALAKKAEEPSVTPAKEPGKPIGGPMLGLSGRVVEDFDTNRNDDFDPPRKPKSTRHPKRRS